MQENNSSFYSKDDLERFQPETKKSSTRNEFERDKARLLYSQAINRLQYKTQVFTSGNASQDDTVKTRLTHSLEVAQIGRRMATILGLDPDLVETACLAHDIGHPPFGHLGESVLNDIAADIGGFEANAQTFRILTKLEPKVLSQNNRSVGLNLTKATLDATIKYPWSYYQSAEHKTDSSSIKFNYFLEDNEIFDWVRNSVPKDKKFEKSMECQVMDISDDISYSSHDYADGIKGFYITYDSVNEPKNIDRILQHCLENYNHNFSLDDLTKAFESLKQSGYFEINFDGSILSHAKLVKLTSTLIGEFVGSITNETLALYMQNDLTRYNANIIVPPETKAKILIFKSIETLFVMQNESVLNTKDANTYTIKKIIEYLMNDNPNPREQLDPIFLQSWQNANNDNERLRVAIDQVASLTDITAQRLSFLH